MSQGNDYFVVTQEWTLDTPFGVKVYWTYKIYFLDENGEKLPAIIDCVRRASKQEALHAGRAQKNKLWTIMQSRENKLTRQAT